MSSMPLIPPRNPGKFSTSEVVVSWPPGAMPLAIHPSKRMGFNSTRDAYMAAVWAAGPLPMIAQPCFEGMEIIHGRSQRNSSGKGGCLSRCGSGSYGGSSRVGGLPNKLGNSSE
nr:hypothetical protein CFP56_39211 [Quercus suber]